MGVRLCLENKKTIFSPNWAEVRLILALACLWKNSSWEEKMWNKIKFVRLYRSYSIQLFIHLYKMHPISISFSLHVNFYFYRHNSQKRLIVSKKWAKGIRCSFVLLFHYVVTYFVRHSIERYFIMNFLWWKEEALP